MVVHDEEGNLREKLKLVKDCGYMLLESIVLDKHTWWKEYYSPLQRLVNRTFAGYGDKEKIPKIVESDRREIEWFESSHGGSRSVIFVMQSVE